MSCSTAAAIGNFGCEFVARPACAWPLGFRAMCFRLSPPSSKLVCHRNALMPFLAPALQGYMAEAISAGMGYCWDRLGVPPAALQHVAGVCSELLGRQLTWRPGPPRPHEQGQEQGEQGDGQQPPQAVGSKRPPPCSPSNLAVAVAQPGCECATAANQGAQSTQAAAADGNGSSISAGNEHAQPPAQRSQPMDILELLLAAGHKLRELKEERFEEVSYGQLRLVLAHLGRLNPGPWDS